MVDESGELDMTLYTANEAGPAVPAEAAGDLVPLLPPGEVGIKEWWKRRERLRSEWLEMLGPFPEQTALEPEVLSHESDEDHERYLVQYTTEPGARVEAYLLVPKDLDAPAPAAVVFHSTSSNNILQPVGLADPPTRHLALYLTQRGYVTLSPRNYIFGYGEEITMENLARERGANDWRAARAKLAENQPGLTGMGKMVWDGMRAVDYLESRPEVDSERIAAVGHSLGAKEALYAIGFDPRVHAAISSEGGVGLPLSNWEAPWYLGEQVEAEGFTHDNHEVLALAAPRPFLLIGGGQSDGAFSWPYIEAVKPVYALYGESDNAGLLLHNGGHNVPVPVREGAFDWLDGYLKN